MLRNKNTLAGTSFPVIFEIVKREILEERYCQYFPKMGEFIKFDCEETDNKNSDLYEVVGVMHNILTVKDENVFHPDLNYDVIYCIVKIVDFDKTFSEK